MPRQRARPPSTAAQHRGIPRATSPGALAVTDGTETIGVVVEHDHSFFSFDTTGTLVGEFDTLAKATRSLPAKGRA
jgi:hypothetical protein